MWPETIAPLRGLGNGLDRTYSELMLGRLRDPVLPQIHPRRGV